MKKNSKDTISVTPLGDKVLIKPLTDEEMGSRSPSGIIIPDTIDREKADRGKIIAVGEGRVNDDGDLISMRVKVGMKVIFQWGDKIELQNEEYYLVGESNILAILK